MLASPGVNAGAMPRLHDGARAVAAAEGRLGLLQHTVAMPDLQKCLVLRRGPSRAARRAPCRSCRHDQEVAGDILREQTPKQLLAVRGKVYELLASCVPPELILRTLLVELLKKLDDEVKVGAH